MQLSNLYVLLSCSSILLHIVTAGVTCEQDLAVIKEKRLGAIKNQILSKLNMTEAPPNPVNPKALSPDILEAYYVIKDAFERDAIARSSGCVDNNYFARKVSLFAPMQEVYYDQNPTQPSTVPSTFPTDINDNDGTLTNDNINLYDYPIRGGAQEGQNLSFSIQLPTGSSNEIDYAEIRLRKACTQGDFADFSQICYADNIYATVEVYLRINTTHGIRKLFVTGRSLVLNDGKPWEEFEISEAVQQCLSLQPYKTEVHLELEIKLNPSNNLPYNIDPYKFFQNSAANLTTTTQLVVFAVSEKDIEEARRRKRQVSKEFCFANFTTNCCVRNLTINFHEDLDWTWVIAPTEYQPNYCSGDCPYLWPSATLHASALQTLKFLNPAASAEPCCVPAMLLPLTIVREDPDTGGLIFEPLSEMIVDSCICR